jgi:HEPN domain-containing protein
MNRADLQGLADMRLREAEVLFEAAYYEGAYYLAGYAAECALKACIAKQTRRYDFPDKRLVLDSYTHDLRKLVRAAGLRRELDRRLESDDDFRLHWNVLAAWSVEDRYTVSVEAEEAKALLAALRACI